MFRKAADVKLGQANYLSGKDTKKVVAALVKEFTTVSSEEIHESLGLKPKAKVFKLKLPKHITCYGTEDKSTGEKTFLFYDVNTPHGDFYPTVFALWKLPKLLKSVLVHAPVSAYVLNGADVMLRGYVREREETVPGSCFGIGKFEKGEKICVVANGNPFPFGVGVTSISSKEIYCSGFNGKGMIVHHCYGDKLWEVAGKAVPNEYFLQDQVVRIPGNQNDEDSVDDESLADVDGDIGNDIVNDIDTDGSSNVKDVECSESVPDEAQNCPEFAKDWDATKTLEMTFLQAIKKKVKDSHLPMLVSHFYSNILLPSRPVGTEIDIKKTRHKKVSKLLQHMKKQKLIKFDDKNGIQNLTVIYRNVSEYKSFTPWNADDEAGNEEVEAKMKELQLEHKKAQGASVSEYYRPLDKFIEIFKAVSASGQGPKNQFYSRSQAREVLFKYVAKENLHDESNPRNIHLDPLLVDLLYKRTKKQKPGFEPPAFASRDEACKRFIDGLQIYHQVSRTDGSISKLTQGKVEPLAINVVGRPQNQKFLTLVYGLDRFGIDAEEFINETKTKFGCSVTLGQCPKNPKRMAVQLQGNKARNVQEYLVGKYKLKSNHISINQ